MAALKWNIKKGSFGIKPMYIYQSLTYKVRDKKDKKILIDQFKKSAVYKNRTNNFTITSLGNTITISGHKTKGAVFPFLLADNVDSAIQKTPICCIKLIKSKRMKIMGNKK